MAIFCKADTKILVQGITGRDGGFHSKSMLDYGTNIVAGVTPGRGGQTFENKVPVFDNVADAVAETGADTSVIFVPPAGAAGAVLDPRLELPALTDSSHSLWDWRSHSAQAKPTPKTGHSFAARQPGASPTDAICRPRGASLTASTSSGKHRSQDLATRAPRSGATRSF